MSFNDIKGQDRAVSFLKNSIARRRIANAYIFCGPEGVGKRLAALNFAKAINCPTPIDAAGCDACPSCAKINSLNHPDVFLATPEKAGGSVKIDDIRAVIEDVGLKPYEAKKKVYIIDEANSLTEEAANALLKTLEEPSADAALILIAENPAELLPTIRSRCQVVKFFAIDSAVVKEILIKGHGLDEVIAHILANISCGRMSQALHFKEGAFFKKREDVISALSANTFSDLDFDKTSKIDLKALLDIMLTWYRDILVMKTLDRSVVNIDKIELISRASGKISFDKLDNVIKQIISTRIYLDQNANPKLAMAALGLIL